MNVVVLSGRIVKKPELKYSKSGAEFTKFTLAVSGRKNEQTNKYDTYFIDVHAFKQLAVSVAKYGDKGKRVIINGTIAQFKYNEPETNRPRSKINVILERINYLDLEKSEYRPSLEDNSAIEGEILDDEDLPF